MAMDEAARRRVRVGRLLMQGKPPAEVAAYAPPKQSTAKAKSPLLERGRRQALPITSCACA